MEVTLGSPLFKRFPLNFTFAIKMTYVPIQSCPTLCDPMDCSLLGSSAHGMLQARILEEVAISFSRGSSQARN